MKNSKKLLLGMLATVIAFSLAACNPDTANDNADDDNENTLELSNTENGKGASKEEQPKTFEISQEIKNAMALNNHLSGSNYFLASDGSILVMGDNSRKGHADVYATIPNVKKIIRGAGAVFALTNNGDLYYENNVIATDISDVAYCTTNSNVEGYCLKGSDIMWITSDETIFEYKRNSGFEDLVSREQVSGVLASIEVDKHDFFVVNEEGKFFAYVSNPDQYAELDFAGFENLVLVDMAKHMGNGEVESLTVAGLKGDGSVIATGTYAEEIMGWGTLSYLTMSDGMIVGLTSDGTLKMTGDYAAKMKETVESWTNIVAVEAGYAQGNNIGYIISAMDADGTFHYVSLTQERSGICTGFASVEGGASGDDFWHRYTPDGKDLFSENGAWIEE